MFSALTGQAELLVVIGLRPLANGHAAVRHRLGAIYAAYARIVVVLDGRALNVVSEDVLYIRLYNYYCLYESNRPTHQIIYTHAEASLFIDAKEVGGEVAFDGRFSELEKCWHAIGADS